MKCWRTISRVRRFRWNCSPERDGAIAHRKDSTHWVGLWRLPYGKSVDQFLQQRILEPLGMKDTFFSPSPGPCCPFCDPLSEERKRG